jgi:predicted deacylase
LGPHTLLNAYKSLKGYKIIYFPVANPSGFIKHRRQTVPGEIDPNRDYPIDGNTHCYQTTATHIIDMLFRKYNIDLTIVLHNGGSQISFNWGTFANKDNSHTEEYDIYIDIARMLGR